MSEPLRKKHEMRNFDFCYGAAVNYYDMNDGHMYMIQEYREAIDRGERPSGINIQDGRGNVVGVISE